MRRLLLLLPALAWLASALPAAAQEERAGFLGRQVENALSGPGREVRVTGFEGALSSRATMDRLTVADSEGVWLTIEDAVLDWTRSALLRRRLSVAELSAGSITVARPPVPAPREGLPEPPPAAASGFSLPELPVAVAIDRLAVERLILGQPVLGERAVFAADGALRLEGGEGAADLALVRQDGTDDRIALDTSFSNETRVLALDLAVREGAGGLVGTLAGLPGAPSLVLDAAGTGPLDDYTAEIDLATDGATRMAGTVRLRGAEAGGLRFAADLGGDVAALVAPDYRGFFGSDVALRADGLRGEDGALTIEDLDLRTRSLDLSGRLALDAEGVPRGFALTGRLADPAGGPVRLPVEAPLTLAGAELSARYDAAAGERWTLDLAARGVAAEAADIDALTLSGGGTLAQQDGALRVSADLDYGARGLALADAALQEALGAEVGGAARIVWSSAAPLSVESFTLGGADYGLTVGGDAAIAERTLALDGSAALSAEDLSRFSGLAGRPLAGAAEIGLNGRGDVLGGSFDLALDVAGEGLAIGQELADRLLEGPVTLSAAVARDTTGTELERFALDSAAVTATASGRLGGGGALDLEVALADLGVLRPDLEGPLRVAGRASETEPGLWDGAVEISGAYDLSGEVAGRVGLGAAAGRSDVTLDLALPDLSPLVAGLEGGVAVRGSAAERGGGIWAVDLDVDAPAGARLAVAGALAGADAGVDIRAEIPDIAAFAPGVPGAARLQGRVVPRAAGGYGVTAEAELPYAATATLDGRLGGAGTTLSYALQVPDLAPLAPPLTGPARAEGRLRQLPSGRFAVTADAEAPFGATLSAEAGIGAGPLAADVTARLPDVAPLVPRFSGAATLQARLEQPQGSETFELRADAALPYGASARVAGQVGAGAGELRLDATLPDVAPVARGLSGRLAISGTARERPEGWAVDLRSDGPGAAAVSVIGVVAPAGATSLRAQGTAPLGLVNGILAPQRLDGDLRIDLALDGAPGLDALSGRLSTTGARLTLPAAGLAFRDIALTADLRDGRVVLDGSAGGPEGGRLDLSGPITLGAGLPGDLTIAPVGLVLEDPALYRTTLDGRITVSGPLVGGGGAIAGRLEVGETELRIPSGGVGFGADIPQVSHLAESAAVRRTRVRAGLVNERREAREAEGRAPGPGFALDLEIDAPNRIFLRGRGLDAELGGGLSVGGTTRAPTPVGGIEVIRGRLDILGKRLELSQDGQLTLGGDLVPFLDLTARSDDAEDLTILIRIEGPVDSPSFTFESQPPLPEDEILARFFFDKGLANLSPLQAAQLAASVARLTGRGGGGLLGGLRERLGVADLDVVTDENGGTAVQVGAYLSENVYTDVTTSTDGQSEVNLNIDITDDVTLKGAADSAGETSIGLFYERDY